MKKDKIVIGMLFLSLIILGLYDVFGQDRVSGLGTRPSKRVTLQIGGIIMGAPGPMPFYYRGIISDNTIVFSWGVRVFFLPIKYDYEYYVRGMHITILDIDHKTFEVTMCWRRG